MLQWPSAGAWEKCHSTNDACIVQTSSTFIKWLHLCRNESHECFYHFLPTSLFFYWKIFWATISWVAIAPCIVCVEWMLHSKSLHWVVLSNTHSDIVPFDFCVTKLSLDVWNPCLKKQLGVVASNTSIIILDKDMLLSASTMLITKCMFLHQNCTSAKNSVRMF